MWFKIYSVSAKNEEKPTPYLCNYFYELFNWKSKFAKVDLIDMKCLADGDHQFILNYHPIYDKSFRFAISIKMLKAANLNIFLV